MGDYGDLCRDMREHRRITRELFGIPCEGCKKKEPKREPTLMMPQKQCKVCGYQDYRTWQEIAIDQFNRIQQLESELINQAQVNCKQFNKINEFEEALEKLKTAIALSVMSCV